MADVAKGMLDIIPYLPHGYKPTIITTRAGRIAEVGFVPMFTRRAAMFVHNDDRARVTNVNLFARGLPRYLPNKPHINRVVP